MTHPSLSRLVRYTDEELSQRSRKRIASHLMKCGRCRSYVEVIRSMREGAEQFMAEDPPGRLRAVILGRLLSGERVILPTDESHASKTLRVWYLAAAVILLAIGAVIITPSGQLGAERAWGELTITPHAPERAGPIVVEYRPPPELRRADSLILRARFRTRLHAQDNRAAPPTNAAVLKKRGDGVFLGRFHLDQSTVYAAFSIATVDDSSVDSNARRLWELLRYEGGTPTRDALWQQQNDLIGRDWERALATARLAATLYPDDARQSARLSNFETSVVSPAELAGLRTTHSSRFQSLNAIHHGAAGLSGDQLAGMLMLARLSLQPTALIDYWRNRLLSEHPLHPLAIQELTVQLVSDLTTHDLLQALEQLWQEVGAAHRQILTQGFRAARQIGDPTAIHTWAIRYTEYEPWREVDRMASIAGIRGVGPLVLPTLRAALEDWDPNRPPWQFLHETKREKTRRAIASRASALEGIARALLALGETDAALDTLLVAASVHWDKDLLLRIAELHDKRGDTFGAITALAGVTVDPTTPTARRDSIVNEGLRILGQVTWAQVADSLSNVMFDLTLANQVDIPIVNEDIAVYDEDNRATALGELTGGRVAVVGLWSRRCAPSRLQLPAFNRVSAEVIARGGTVVAITGESPSESLRAYLRQQAPGLPVYYDLKARAPLAFNSWVVPHYFVLDEFGHIRFESTSTDELLHHVSALLSARRTGGSIVVEP